MPSVARLSVTPVKGTALHHPNEIRVERFGVPGNRLFFFVDPQGRRYKTRGLNPLLPVRADYDAHTEQLTLAFPGGPVVSGDARPGPEALTVDLWGRQVKVHIVEGPFSAAASEAVGRSLRLVRCEQEGDGNDLRAITLVSSASFTELARHAGRNSLDRDRFRMTIELDGLPPHGEDAWSGRSVRIGEALLRVEEPVPRCVVTTWNPATGAADFNTLRTIASYRTRTPDGLPFGVYASVLEPGRARVGDRVEPDEPTGGER